MSTWPKDNPAALKVFYGDPAGANGEANPRWIVANLRPVAFPWRTVAAWDTGAVVKSARVHHKCADALDRVLRNIWEECGHDQAKIESMGMHLFGGAFNFRVKRGLSSLSVHAFGAALDFDPLHNPLGSHDMRMAPLVVEAFRAEGAVWGGDFKSRKDGMHFQFATI